jgi:hypothetical protein
MLALIQSCFTNICYCGNPKAATEGRGNVRHFVDVTVRCNEKHYGKSVTITCQLPTVTRLVWMPRAVWRSNPDTVCVLL